MVWPPEPQGWVTKRFGSGLIVKGYETFGMVKLCQYRIEIGLSFGTVNKEAKCRHVVLTMWDSNILKYQGKDANSTL